MSDQPAVTLILWAISFMNLIVLYFLSNCWLPTVMRDAGYTPGTAVIVGTVLQTGGVIGTLLLGGFIARMGFVRVLFACFAVATVAVGTIGAVAACAAMAARRRARGRDAATQPRVRSGAGLSLTAKTT
jgi:MFS family permease